MLKHLILAGVTFAAAPTPLLTAESAQPGATPPSIVAARKDEESADSIDARLFGALGDDTRDDTEALRAAVAAASLARKDLVLPGGTYRLKSVVELPSHTTIRCAQGRTRLLFENAAGIADALLISHAVDVAIDGCMIEGSRQPPTVSRLLSVVGGSSRIQITRSRFSGSGGNGTGPFAAVRIEGGSDITLRDNTFTDNGPLGVVDPASGVVLVNRSSGAAGHASRIQIEGNRWFSNSAVFPLALFNVSETAVVGNRIDQGNVLGSPKTSGYGILLYSVANAEVPMRDNRVSGNTITNTAGSGIYLQGSSYSTVSDNVVRDCAKQQADDLLSVGCISVSAGYASSPSAVNVTVSGNVIDGSSRSGISVANGNGISITGNTLDHLALRGIQLITNNIGTVIAGNTVRNSGSHGVLIRNRATRTTIVGNSIERAMVGVGDYESTESIATLIAGNSIASCEWAVRMGQGMSAQVVGNSISQSGRPNGGAIETGGVAVLVALNSISEAPGDAVLLTPTSGRAQVFANIVRGVGRLNATDLGEANAIMETSSPDANPGAGRSAAAPTVGALDRMSGVAQLVSGRARIATRAVRSDDRILLSRQTIGLSPGHLAVEAIKAGSGFRIASSSSSDDGSVNWVVLRGFGRDPAR